jgi:protein disulfide-isomerase A6
LTPEYRKLGEIISKDPSLNTRVVLAKVNADDHQSIGERFQVRGFPTIKWFPRARPSDPLDYNSARTAEAMLDFIKKQIEFDNSFAVVAPLSDIAIKFTEGEIDAAAALKEAKDAVAKLDDDVKDNAALYIKYLEKAAEKGKEYIETELARLHKMISGGKMSTTKLIEVSKKISVLESFSRAEAEAEIEGEIGGDEEEIADEYL